MATPKVTPAFTAAYRALNTEQKKAVDTLDGPVMVIAGPGTGKTQVLALRIANILKETDAPPSSILALTYTKAGAYAMRTRLVSLIGTAAYQVHIHTFHSFCESILQQHTHEFDRLIGASHISDIDSVATLREVLDALTLVKLKKFGDPYFFVNDIRAHISELKREAITPDDVQRRVDAEQRHIEQDPDTVHTKGAHKGKMKAEFVTRLEALGRTRELREVYAAYEAALQKKRLYDFDDMILETISALTHNDAFRQVVQEEFLYILADEHQDANTAQNTLLTLLTSYDPSPNLFLVGDDKQAIFSFQGASLAHFRGFKKAYPDAVEITLTSNYRSGQKVLDAAHALMSPSPEHGSRNPTLQAERTDGHLAEVVYAEYSTEEHERAAVAREIQTLLHEGVDAREIAVIYRNNKDAAALAATLTKEGIAHTVTSTTSALDNHTVAQFVTYLRAVVAWGSDMYFARTIHAPFVGEKEYEIYKALLDGKRKGLGAFEVYNTMPTHKDFFASMQTLAQHVHSTDARTFFDRALRESGCLAYILGRHDAHEVLACMRGVGQTLETLARSRADYTLRDFLADLDLFEEYDLRIEKDESLAPKSGVQLMTAHKSKGLEFTYVFIVHCRDKKWGNTRGVTHFVIPGLEKETKEQANEDERRLLYVAITRAKLFCHISLGLMNEEGTQYLPSQFIAELGEHVQTKNTTQEEATYLPHHPFLAAPVPTTPLFDADFLRAQFIEQGLSVTALNNYLLCPWRYFYRNLVRLPEAPSPASLFGNSVHKALNVYLEEYARTEKQPHLQFLLDAFEADLPTQGFFKAEKEEALQRGVESLTGWYATFGTMEGALLGTEYNLEVRMPLTGPAQSVLLRGVIDRVVEALNGDLTVTDFKTGKPKTRGEIEGTTKNSNGDYKRQLAFYKLLLQESKNKTLSYAQIEFVETDLPVRAKASISGGKKGTHKREVFASSELDADCLKQTIENVAHEIHEFTFWGAYCEDKDCDYCALRKSML